MSMIVSKIIELAHQVEMSGWCATRDLEIRMSPELIEQVMRTVAFRDKAKIRDTDCSLAGITIKAKK